MLTKLTVVTDRGSVPVYLDLSKTFEICQAIDIQKNVIIGATAILMCIDGQLRSYTVKLGLDEVAKLVNKTESSSLLS